jgi:hypothetical protein
MNIKKNIFQKKEKSHAIENPYAEGTEGWKKWNDMYENMRASIRFWKKAFFCSTTISIIFALIFVKMVASPLWQFYQLQESARSAFERMVSKTSSEIPAYGSSGNYLTIPDFPDFK